MQKKLWEATIAQKENSNLRSFEKFLTNKYNFKGNKNYNKLLKWSLQNQSSFWSDIWDFAKVKGCLLYTSPSPRDRSISRMPSSA